MRFQQYGMVSIILFCILCDIPTKGEKIKSKQDSVVANTADTVNNSFFHRFYRYFQEANVVKEEKRFDFSIIGGPHFSSDTKLGLGLVASGLYRVDRSDLSISPSNVSIYGDITTTGFYLLGIQGNTILSGEKYRVDVNAYFFSFPSRYWGMGYENAIQQDNYTKYKRLENQVKLDLLGRILPKTYIGASFMYRNVNAKDIDDISFLEGEKSNISSVGVGFQISYDSRDFIPNPYKGFYAKIEQLFFPDFFGNSYAFRRSEITFRNYQQLWNGAILASDLQGIFNYGDTPWSMAALMGGSYKMRGYYEGQYRDNNLVQAQVELRQKIYNRHGVAVWAGAGNIFHDRYSFQWDKTLPTYGLGYRWEFKKRVNVRLDYGFGKDQSAFYFSINEAF